MPAAVLRAVLVQSWRRPGRQLLVGLVVTVATAFAAASLMLTDSARATIIRELAGTPGPAALVVSPLPPPAGSDEVPGVPSGVQQRVLDTPGVAAVAPVGSGRVLVSMPGVPGDGEPWTALTALDGPLSRHPVVAGRLPGEPRDAAVSEETARRIGLRPGDPLSLVGADGTVDEFVVSGVARVRLQALNTVLLQPAVVARMTGLDPEQLDVLPAPGTDVADLGSRLAAAVGRGVAVRDAAVVRDAELGGAFGAVEGAFAALAVFGATAVLAAVLTTSCAFAVVIGRQRHTVVLLRRVGAGRGQVLRALLADAALTGLVAGVLGAALSLGLVQLVRLAVGAWLGEDLPQAPVPVWALGACTAGAVLTTLLAAVGPAVRVSGERPAATSANPSHPVVGRVLRLVATGVLGAASVQLSLLALPVTDQLQALAMVAGAGVLAFAAALAAGPVLLPMVAWLLGIVLVAVTGLSGRLALRSVLRAPRRASTTAAALVLTSLLLSVVLIGLESTSTSADDRIAAQFPATVLAVSTGRRPLPDDLERRIAELPEAGAVAAVRTASMAVDGDADGLTMTSVDPAAFPPLLEGAVDAGSLAALGPGTVALDRVQAARWRVGLGDPVTFAVPGEPVELRVVAVYRSSGVLSPVTVHPEDLPRIVAGASDVRQVLVAPAAAVGADALRAAVAGAVGPDPDVLVRVPADLRTELAGAVQLIRMVALGLVGATGLIAVCGVAVALSLAVRERHRESTTLRALGLTPGQVVATLGMETALLGLAGVVVGTGLGLVFGVLSAGALREPALVPVEQVLTGAGVLVLVAAVAGVLPAVTVARRRPLPSAAD